MGGYPVSRPSWWETGLLTQDAWKSAWIGYETAEEDAVRHAKAAWITNADAKELGQEKAAEQRVVYRKTVTLDKTVRSAALYATGQDTVAAWVNGVQVLTAQPFPAWRQMPWKKFVRADVTGKLSAGANTIAIETVHYVGNPNGAVEATPMIATLVVEFADGTVATFGSGTDWKTAVHAAAGLAEKGFDDSGWKNAAEWAQAPGPMNGPLGHPWIPDSVKAAADV
jgi:alpha-L-rhamnosidase